MGSDSFNFLQYVKTTIRDSVNDLMEPQDQPVHALMTYGSDGVGFLELGIPKDEADKEHMVKVAMCVTALAGARECAFIGAAHEFSRQEVLQTSQDVHRSEAMILLHAAFGGSVRLHVAGLNRYVNRPPDLGSWESLGDAALSELGMAIQTGMKLAAMGRSINLWSSASPLHIRGPLCGGGLDFYGK